MGCIFWLSLWTVRGIWIFIYAKLVSEQLWFIAIMFWVTENGHIYPHSPCSDDSKYLWHWLWLQERVKTPFMQGGSTIVHFYYSLYSSVFHLIHVICTNDGAYYCGKTNWFVFLLVFRFFILPIMKNRVLFCTYVCKLIPSVECVGGWSGGCLLSREFFYVKNCR